MEEVSRSLTLHTSTLPFPLYSNGPTISPLILNIQHAVGGAACPCHFDMQTDKRRNLLKGAEGEVNK